MTASLPPGMEFTVNVNETVVNTFFQISSFLDFSAVVGSISNSLTPIE